MTSDQVELVRRLDELTRAVLKGWLLRGIDSADAKALMERLSDRGLQFREGLSSHADAMVLNGIMSPAQVCALRTNEMGQQHAASGGRNDVAEKKPSPSKGLARARVIDRRTLAALHTAHQSRDQSDVLQ